MGVGPLLNTSISKRISPSPTCLMDGRESSAYFQGIHVRMLSNGRCPASLWRFIEAAGDVDLLLSLRKFFILPVVLFGYGYNIFSSVDLGASRKTTDLVDGTLQECGLGFQPDSPHKPVSLVWFYFQDATKEPQVFYHENNVSSFKVNPLSLQWLSSHL